MDSVANKTFGCIYVRRLTQLHATALSGTDDAKSPFFRRTARGSPSSPAEKPRLWSDGHFTVRGPNRMFDLHPDGERFALARKHRARGSTTSKNVFLDRRR